MEESVQEKKSVPLLKLKFSKKIEIQYSSRKTGRKFFSNNFMSNVDTVKHSMSTFCRDPNVHLGQSFRLSIFNGLNQFAQQILI